MLTLRKPLAAEIPAITRISREAFDTDVTVGAPGPGGPPFYDDEAWHRAMARSGNLFTLAEDGRVVGGLLVFRDAQEPGVVTVGRVFVSPVAQGRGFGRAAMTLAETLLPGTALLRLDTPVWNRRTNRFYPALGYRETGRDAESVFYEKRVGEVQADAAERI